MIKKEVVQNIHKYRKELSLLRGEIKRITKRYNEDFDQHYLERLCDSVRENEAGLQKYKLLLKQLKRDEKERGKLEMRAA